MAEGWMAMGWASMGPECQVKGGKGKGSLCQAREPSKPAMHAPHAGRGNISALLFGLYPSIKWPTMPSSSMRSGCVRVSHGAVAFSATAATSSTN